jgi:putative Holliday junction resolvase
MSRILAIDYGSVRIGVAVSDPGQIIATGLATVANKEIFDFLTDYIKKEKVESIVVGEPKHMDNSPAQSAEGTEKFIEKVIQSFPGLPVYRVDERLTSRMALQAMIDGGMKKKDRRDKGMIDKVSAVIILQLFMEMKKEGKLPPSISG